MISEQKYESAVEYAEYSYTELKKRLGEDHADTLTSMHYLGFAKEIIGKDANYGILNDCLKRRTRVLGAAHKDTLAIDEALKFLTACVAMVGVIQTCVVVAVVAVGLRFLYVWATSNKK